ncbi:RelA/SpoT domain-containing protein, partial [Stenotrophomonas maltophilia]|nr:RelA/SpoT domain-containing protein [Stenotrophomonas maltophilia]
MKNDQDIGDYIEANRESLERWGRFVADSISADHASLLKMPAPPRVKDPDSARKKQLKKMYPDPIVDMTDLVGVRFVVLTSDDLRPILETITSSTNWRHKQTRDPDAEAAKDPSSFNYQSHHYELRPPSGDQWCCEVQVRTLLQHTIAELSHDAFYKASHEVPSQAMRLVARSIALMETTDELLCMAMASVRAAQAPFDALR